MDRLYFAASILGLAVAVWWLVDRNDDLGDQLGGAEARIETLKNSQEITNDVYSLDDGALGAELDRRLSGAGPE